jgi:alkyl hydroperoxide reductase subunit AhpC
MTVSIDQPAPDVELEAYVPGELGPRRIRLAEHVGRWLVLFFYPRDFTFTCPAELAAFARLEPQFAAEGATLLASSTDSYWSHRAWFQTDARLRTVAFPVLADTAHVLSRAFGVRLEDGSTIRGTAVIDPAGIVRHLAVSAQAVGSPEDTLRALRALRADELRPRPDDRALLAV